MDSKEDACDDLLQALRGKAVSRVILPLDAKDVVDAITQRCLDSGKMFRDSAFPPNDKSLNRRSADEKPLVGSAAGPGQWQRARDAMPSADVFVGGVSSSDVLQGALDNCWLIGAVCSLSARPDIIKDSIYPNKYNPAGIYAVKIFRRGEWGYVIVDDYVYVNSVLEQPYFIHSKDDGELWPVIYEKVVAKIYGSYQDLWPTCSMCIEPMYAFTGGIMSYYSDKDPDKAWAKLQEVWSNGGIIGTGGNESKTELQVVGGHAYSVLGCLEHKDVRIVKLRNTWGRYEWQGDWSDKSEKWDEYPELKEKANLSVADDGVFWIGVQDLLDNFTGLELCRLKGKPGPEEVVLEPEYCFSDTYKDWTGDGFHETTTVQGSWSPANRTGGLESGSCPMYSLVLDQDATLRIRLTRTGGGNGAPWAVLCRGTGKGRVHWFDDRTAEDEHKASHILKKCNIELFHDIELTRSMVPYVIVPWAISGTGQFTLEIKTFKKLQLKELPKEEPVAVIEDEWKGDNSTGLLESDGIQYHITVEKDGDFVFNLSMADWTMDDPGQCLAIMKGSERIEEPAVVEDEDTMLCSESEVTAWAQYRCFLPAGDYIVLPCLEEEDVERQFDLSVYSQDCAQLKWERV